MQLDRLTVHNFRNLADVDLPLTPGTVIVGENRSGKTNLLHALRLVLDPTMSYNDRRLRDEDFWDGLSDGTPQWDPRGAGEIIKISVELTDFEDEPAVVAALADALIAGEPMRARLTYEWSPHEAAASSGKPGVYRWRIFGGEDEGNTLSADLREYIFLSFLHALRDVENDIRGWRRSPLRRLLEASAAAAAASSDLETVREAMAEANDQVNSLPAIADLSTRISDRTLAMVGDDQALDTQLGVAPPDPVRIIRSMQIFVDGDARRQLSSASLGTLNVLYLALLELGLEERLVDLDIAHVILAVEEPEAHLHPHLQRVIFRRLLASEAKSSTTIVTTQSPFIASVTPPRSLIALRTVDGRTLAAAASTADLDDSDWADIERYLDATRAELVFARRVLMVEGYGEQVLIPAFADSMGLDLDKLGISVCAIFGTHFFSYLRFCQALAIPWAVVTDGDLSDEGVEVGKQRAQALAERLNSNQQQTGIFVGSTTLEYDVFTASERNSRACIDVFKELAPTDRFRQSAERLNDAIPANLPSYERFMRAVERCGGKGRFGQRLSLKELDVPTYVRQAIEYLTNT